MGPLLSQNIYQGKILDQQTKEPLIGAAACISKTTNGALTDAAGGFRVNSDLSNDTLEVRYPGYANEKFRVYTDQINIILLTPSATKMDEVVVTASREIQQRSEVPMAISKISFATIDDTKPVLISELMNKVSGVTMLNLNNEQHGMGIRQPMGTSNYFLYMEDGIPLRPMGVFNHNALIEMNLFAISSVEIVKGPASSLYGPEAVGGAINFITQKPTALRTVKAGVQLDNFGYKRFQYGTGGMINRKLGYYVGGYYANQKNGWMSNSDYDKNSVNMRFDYDLKPGTKLIFAGAYNNYYSQTGGSVDSVAFYSRDYVSTTDFTYRKVNSLRMRVSLEEKWNENNFTMLHVFYRDNVIDQNPAYAIRWNTGKTTAAGQINSNKLSSRGFIAQHSASFIPLKTKLIAGISVDNSPNTYNAYQVDLNAQLRNNGLSVQKFTINALRPDILLSDYSALIWNYAAYSQAELKVFKNTTLNFGARYDIMSFSYSNKLDNTSGTKSFSQLSPKAGATYKINDGAGIYANYAKGFSPPGLTTVFTKKPNTQPADFYYELAPAEFTNYEIGGWFSLIKNKVNVEVSLYQLNGRNELLNVRQPDNSTDYQSAGRTTHQGVEYNLLVNATRELSFRVSGTNAMHRYDEFFLSTNQKDILKNVNGKYMPSAPSCILNSELTYKPQFAKGLRMSVEWQHMSPWFMDQVNNFKYADSGVFGIQGISVVNFRAGYKWKAFEIFSNVMNISNELYAFNVTRGNSVSSRNIYTPAPPRTFVFGFQYNFISKR